MDLFYLLIEVNFYKLPKSTTVVIPDSFSVTKRLQQGIG